jgi:hypothetical protein
VAWLERVVFAAAEQYAADLIFQVGDFGWWPRIAMNDGFRAMAQRAPVPLWWIDGNHEDHARLEADIEKAGGPRADGLVGLGGNLSFVPRGSRFDFDGVSVVACGGAHSIDRRARTPGVDWFDEEHITDDDVERCVAGGHADVFICHDAPAGWTIPNLPSEHGLPSLWHVELPECWDHRRRVGRVMDGVTPNLVVHGHYHSGYRSTLDTGWGALEIVGLSEDGTSASLALLDCEDATWHIEQVTSPRAAHDVASSDPRERRRAGRQAVAEAIADADLPY